MLGTSGVLFPGMPGTTEMMVILLIAVLLFGANKIPKLARSTGEAMGEFQKGREEVEQELEEMRDGDVPEGTDASTVDTAESTETATETET
jgi:sec-independent protein translocase protein TatA